MKPSVLISIVFLLAVTVLNGQKPKPNGDPELAQKIARFAPVQDRH